MNKVTSAARKVLTNRGPLGFIVTSVLGALATRVVLDIYERMKRDHAEDRAVEQQRRPRP